MTKRNPTRTLLSVLLVLVLAVSLAAIPATAADTDALADGIYLIHGDMVKNDKTTASMADKTINHNVLLTVENGVCMITMQFDGLTIGSQRGYLGELKYFESGYTETEYGYPQGTTADAEILSYQMNDDGSRFSDTFGTDYPRTLTYPMIPEARENGLVPLQVFVAVMESISEGNGTQPVYLKLDWSTLEQVSADDARLAPYTDPTAPVTPDEPVEDNSMSITDPVTGVTVTVPEGAFSTDIMLVIEELTEGETYDTAKNNAFISGKSFKLYEIHFENVEGVIVQPAQAVTVRLPIPEGFNAARLTAYHFDGDTATVVKGTAENGEYVFTADKFSPYALVDLSTGNGLSGNTGLPGNNTLPSGNKSLNGNSGLSGNGSLTLKNGGATGNQSLATGNASLKNGNAHTPQTGDERGNVITVVAVLTVVNAALFAGVMIATKKKKGKEEA